MRIRGAPTAVTGRCTEPSATSDPEEPQPEPAELAAAVEQFDYPTCEVPAGSTCRTRCGEVAPKYHIPRFMLVPQFRAESEVKIPADHGPGRPWEMGLAIEAAVPEAATKPTSTERGTRAHALCRQADRVEWPVDVALARPVPELPTCDTSVGEFRHVLCSGCNALPEPLCRVG